MTRKERHYIYCFALAEAETNKRELLKHKMGICNLIHDLFGLFPTPRPTDSDEIEFRSFLPELWKMRPKNRGSYWFHIDSDGWDKRIQLLKKCVKLTA